LHKSSHGSSPRMRGTLPAAPGIRIRPRFIPADAGNTSRMDTSASRTAVHPRGCGEHHIQRLLDRPVGGSSPRMRGTQWIWVRGVSTARFIPADAGNT